MIEFSGAPLWQRLVSHPQSVGDVVAAEMRLADLCAALDHPKSLRMPQSAPFCSAFSKARLILPVCFRGMLAGC